MLSLSSLLSLRDDVLPAVTKFDRGANESTMAGQDHTIPPTDVPPDDALEEARVRVVGRERDGIVLIARNVDARGRTSRKPEKSQSGTFQAASAAIDPSKETGTTSAATTTRIDLFDVPRKRLLPIFSHGSFSEIVSASINEERTLLAFTTVERVSRDQEDSSGGNAPLTIGTSFIYQSFLVELEVADASSVAGPLLPGSGRVVPLNVKTRNQPQRIQFLPYDREDAHKMRCTPFFIYMCHGEFVRLYKVQCKPKGRGRGGVRISGNPQVCRPMLATAPTWCEYHPELGLLYTLTPQLDSNDSATTGEALHVLQCFQFNDHKSLLSDKLDKLPEKRFEIIVNIPLSHRSAATKLNRAFMFPFHADVSQVAPECEGGGWMTVVHMRCSEGPPVGCLCLQRPQEGSRRSESSDAKSRHDSSGGEDVFDSGNEYPPSIRVSIVMLHHKHRLDFRIPLPFSLDASVRHRTRVLFGSIADMLVAYVPGHFLQLVDCGGDHGPMLSVGGTGPSYAPALPHSSTFVDAPLTPFNVLRRNSRRSRLIDSEFFAPQAFCALDCRHGIVYRLYISQDGLLNIFRGFNDPSSPLVRPLPTGSSSDGGGDSSNSANNSADDSSEFELPRSGTASKRFVRRKRVVPDPGPCEIVLVQAIHLVAVHMRDAKLLSDLLKLVAKRSPAPGASLATPLVLAEYIVGLTYSELIKRVIAVTSGGEHGKVDGPASITGAMLKSLPLSVLQPWRVPPVYRARFGTRFVGPQRPGWQYVPGTKQPTRELEHERERFVLAAAAATEAVATAHLSSPHRRRDSTNRSFGDIDLGDEDLTLDWPKTVSTELDGYRGVILTSPALSGSSSRPKLSSNSSAIDLPEEEDLLNDESDAELTGIEGSMRPTTPYYDPSEGRVVKQPPPPFHRYVSRHFHTSAADQHHTGSGTFFGISGGAVGESLGASSFARAYTPTTQQGVRNSPGNLSSAPFSSGFNTTAYPPATPLVRQASPRATALSVAAARSGSLRQHALSANLGSPHQPALMSAGHLGLGLNPGAETPPPGVKRFLRDLLGLGDDDDDDQHFSPSQFRTSQWSPRQPASGNLEANGEREKRWQSSSALSIERSKINQPGPSGPESVPLHPSTRASDHPLSSSVPALLMGDLDSGASDSDVESASEGGGHSSVNNPTPKLAGEERRRAVAAKNLPPVVSPSFFDTFDEREDRLGRGWLVERLTAHLCQRFPKAADRGMCQAIAKEYANVRGLLVEELYQSLIESVPPFSLASDLSEQIRFRHHQNLFCALEMLECSAPLGYWAQFVRSGVGAIHSREVFVQHVQRGVFVVDPRLVEATCVGNIQSGGAFPRALSLRLSTDPADCWFKQELLVTVGQSSLRHRLMHSLPEHKKYLLHHALDNLPDILSAAAAGQLHAQKARQVRQKEDVRRREQDFGGVVIDVSDLEDGRSGDEKISSSEDAMVAKSISAAAPGLARDISRVWRDLLRVGDDGGFLEMEVANESPFIPVSVFLSALPLPVDRGEGAGSIGAAALKAARIAAAVYDAPIVHFVVHDSQRRYENQFLLPFAGSDSVEVKSHTSAMASAVTDVGVAGIPARPLGSGAHGDNAALPALRSSLIFADDVSSSDGSVVGTPLSVSRLRRTESFGSMSEDLDGPRPDDAFITVDLDIVETTNGGDFSLM